MTDTPTAQVVESKRSLICKPITCSVTQHGPTPYDRSSKPATSQIPNIGKRRSMGALKTAESRVLKEPFNLMSDKENINIPKQVLKRQLDNVYKQISSQEIALQSCVVQPSSVVSKPPLVNSNLKKVMTIGQLKQPSTTNMVPVLQNPLNPCPTVTTMSESSHPSKLPSKIHSKSLQTLPGMVDKSHDAKFDEINKSLSQNDLTSSNMPIQCSSKSIPSNLTKKTRIKPKLGLKGPLGGLRPRISTHISGVETMSTPYNAVQSKHLEYLKISPIISEVDVTDPDSTFSVFQEPSSHASKLLNASCNKCLNVQNKDQCDEIITGQKTQVLENFENHFQNATYNHEYENDQDDECQQKVVCNKTVNLTRNRSEEFDQCSIPAFNTTQILCKDVIASDPNETFGFLDETQVITGKVEANCNKTQILIDDENELFIENEKMPKNFIEDTPGKLNHGLNEFESQNESFSDDIQKVLAAISCKNKNDHNAIVTVSPLKIFTPNKVFSNSSSIDTENANNSPINTENANNLNTTNGSSIEFKSHLPNMSVAATNTFSNADCKITKLNENETVSSVLSENIINEYSEILCNQTDHFDSQKLITECPPEAMPLPDTSEDEDESHNNSIKTPVKKNIHNIFDIESLFPLSAQLPAPLSDGNEEFTYGIENRCYTISMGDIGRRREASNLRLKRSQTYGARDFAYNFRPPRQMQTVETVEGNIVMDNASFLHFTNEIKFLKTQLLKLKRTLLEVKNFSLKSSVFSVASLISSIFCVFSVASLISSVFSITMFCDNNAPIFESLLFIIV